MLKVAIIIERAQIGLGGAERSVSELTAQLRKQGVAATILAAKGTPAEHTKILCEDYAGKRVPLKVFEKAVRQHLENNRYDIVHSTLPLAIADIYQPRGGSYREAMLQNIASYPCAGQRLLKRWTHLVNFKRTQYLLAEKNLCTANKRVIVAALSNYVKEHFQRHYHLPDDRIAVIPNGIHTEMKPDEKAANEMKETILKSIAVPPGKQPVLFLFAANNPRLKGLDPLLASMKQLSAQPAVEAYPVLVIAGTKAIETNLENVVCTGALNGLCEALSICDAAVLPTWYDPCSRFILEALAMGKPVITTRFNGASERYENHRHGVILVRPDAVAELTAALKTFCDRQKIELAHRAIMEDNLAEKVSIEKHAAMLVDLYQSIMTQREKR